MWTDVTASTSPPAASNARRAQSHTVGVILLTAVIIILVGLVSLFLLSNVDSTPDPVADIEVDVTSSTVILTHGGGDPLPTHDVRVTFGRDGTADAPLTSFSELQGDSDGEFEGSERRQTAHNASAVISVTVVHTPTNTVLAQEFLDVPGTTPPATPTPSPESVTWERSADWDASTARSRLIHEDYGDHNASSVELGYEPTGPVAFWPLDEDGGSTATDIAGGNDGTVEGPILGGQGIVGTTSYDFDGTDDYVGDATDLAALRTTGSISTWIRTTQSGDDTMWQAPGLTGVESSGDGDDVFWGWLDADGHIGIQAGNDAAAQSTDPVNDGTWHHVVLTRDAQSGRVEVYVDGSRDDAATSQPGTIDTPFESIGRIEDTAGSPEYFAGRIDEFRVYDRVLSGSEVTELYQTARTGSLTTGGKTFSAPREVSTLELTNVSATRPSEVTVTVESDPDGDGAFEEASDPIALDGSGTHQVTGLTTDSATFRLQISVASPDVAASPTVDTASLEGTG